MIRLNSIGLEYELEETLQGSATIIRLKENDKFIVVNENIHYLSSCWYNWQMKGKFIQDAFPTLTADEREFLMSGITKAEWDEMFSDE